MTTTVIERRNVTGTVEHRAAGDGCPVAAGYAAVFGRRSLDLGGFTEVIDPAAFTKTVAEADIVALWNHDERSLLGRVTSGTLRLTVDERGLAYEVDLPDTSAGRDVAELLRRGDIRGSSFGFRTIRDEWHEDDKGVVTRTLLEVALIDVSPVTRPAYPDSEATVRSIAAVLDHDPAEVRQLINERHLGTLIAPPERDEEPKVTDDEGRAEPTPVEREHLTWLYA